MSTFYQVIVEDANTSLSIERNDYLAAKEVFSRCSAGVLSTLCTLEPWLMYFIHYNIIIAAYNILGVEEISDSKLL